MNIISIMSYIELQIININVITRVTSCKIKITRIDMMLIACLIILMSVTNKKTIEAK